MLSNAPEVGLLAEDGVGDDEGCDHEGAQDRVDEQGRVREGAGGGYFGEKTIADGGLADC